VVNVVCIMVSDAKMQVSVRIPKDIHEKLTEIAQKRRLGLTDIIVQACAEYLERGSDLYVTREELKVMMNDPEILRGALKNIQVRFEPND